MHLVPRTAAAAAAGVPGTPYCLPGPGTVLIVTSSPEVFGLRLTDALYE